MDRIAYESFAKLEDTHFWFVSRRRIFFDILDRLLSRRSDQKILEIGCGAGGLMGPMQRYGQVHGLDIDHEYLRFCNNRGFKRLVCGSGYELPFADASFDLVTLFDTIEHIPDDVRTLQEARRVLRPGGLVFVSVPAYQWLWSQNDRIAHHHRRYTKRGLRRTMLAAGLEPQRLTYFNSFLLPLIIPAVLWQKFLERRGKLPEDFNNTSVKLAGPLNWLFTQIMSSERWLLRGLSLPFGHSLIGVASSPEAPQSAARPDKP